MEESQPVQTPNNDSQTEMSPVSSEKKQTLWFVIGLTILLIFSLGATGYFAYQNNQLKRELQTANSNLPSIEAKSSPTPTTEQLKASPSPTSSDQENSYSNVPQDWKKHEFPLIGLTIYSPPTYQSSLEEFPEDNSKLIRFWQGSSPDTATIQLNIKGSWDSTGNAKDLPRYFLVAETIPAAKADPPLMEEVTLERYQTNYYFEYQNKVYVLTCVHNWITKEYQACEKMLQTIEFTSTTQ